MDDFELAAIDEVVKSEIKPNSNWRKYDRTLRTPMNLVLDEAEPQLSKKLIVYWVDGGFPELFTRSGFSVTPVVWNSRYTEIVAFIREIMVEGPVSNFRSDLLERGCLKIIAELSLRYTNPDLAVQAFLKSMVGKGIYLDINLIDQLETWPISEAYMSTWFFGLVHELGHSISYSGTHANRGLFSNEMIEAALEIAVRSHPMPTELEQTRRQLMQTAALKNSRHSLSIDHLRSEAEADSFATNVLFQSTIKIMWEAKREVFETPQTMAEMSLNYVQEIVMMVNIMSLIERCTATAKVGSGLRDQDSIEALALHPGSFFYRMGVIRQALAFRIASLFSNPDSPSEESIDGWREVVESVSDSLEDVIKEVEAGLARAMRFVFFPQEREAGLMKSFAEEATQRHSVLARIEAQRFCELADSLGVTGEALETLRNIA